MKTLVLARLTHNGSLFITRADTLAQCSDGYARLVKADFDPPLESLWYTHDLDAVPGADRITLAGPAAARYIRAGAYDFFFSPLGRFLTLSNKHAPLGRRKVTK